MESIEVMKSEVQAHTEDNNKDNEKDESKVKNVQEKGRLGKFYAGVKERCNAFLEKTKVYEKLEQMTSYLETSPLLTCGLFAVLVGMAIPIVLFVLFAVVNVAFVVAGFIILEVTIFIIGSTVLSSSVFFVITTAAMIALCLLSFYLILCYFINLLKKFRENESQS